ANDAVEVLACAIEGGNKVLYDELHRPGVFFVRIEFDGSLLEILPLNVVESVIMEDHGLEQHEDFLFFGRFHAKGMVKIRTKTKRLNPRWGRRTGRLQFCRQAVALCG